MAKIKILLLPILCVALIQCATEAPTSPVVETVIIRDGQATYQLAQTANYVDQSLKELNRIQAVATPPINTADFLDPSIPELQQNITLDWVGPIAPLVKKIAELNHFKVREIGQEPAIPILVSVTAKNVAAIEVLRNIDYQARPKAELEIFTNLKVIEIRYANN